MTARAFRSTQSTPRAASSTALDLPPTPTIKVDARDAKALAALDANQVNGKVVLAEVPTPYKVERSRMAEANRARLAFLQRMDTLKPALIVDVDRDTESVLGLRRDLAGRRLGQVAKLGPEDHPALPAARQGLRRHARRAVRRDAQPARRQANGATRRRCATSLVCFAVLTRR